MSATLSIAGLRHPVRPEAPDVMDGLGIPRSLVGDLALRHLWMHGAATLTALHNRLKLSFPILETLFHELRQQQLLEVKGMVGNDYRFTLTEAGRNRAAARQEVCQYAGPAPVSLQDYQHVVRSQSARIRLNREQVRALFADLVLPDSLLDQLGPSLIGHRSLFLYGETGGGKSSIAERLLRVYEDSILVPYALEVDGHIVTVFDPAVHQTVPTADDAVDPRWVECERPCITVGGELSAAMLELQIDRATKVYTSPCQLKANNGLLIIDDFGRQMISPRELLNRWIVPLDRRVDYLTLGSGTKFEAPFELMVVFSTNLDPNDLVDEAFLRRIQAKVLVGDVSPEIFDRIFDHVVSRNGARCVPDAAEYLRRRCFAAGAKRMRACFPADVCHLARAIADYEGTPMELNHASIDRAVELYFARTPRAANQGPARS
jgi:predicted ATPase with chaperone activity